MWVEKIEAARRLVEDEELRVVGEGHREGEFRALPPRKIVDLF